MKQPWQHYYSSTPSVPSLRSLHVLKGRHSIHKTADQDSHGSACGPQVGGDSESTGDGMDDSGGEDGGEDGRRVTVGGDDERLAVFEQRILAPAVQQLEVAGVALAVADPLLIRVTSLCSQER